MKVIVAGCRDFFEWKPVLKAIEDAASFPAPNAIVITELVCGMAPGVDETAYWWAKMARIPIKEEPADWNRFGKAAGPIRNREMAKYGQALIALWDGISPGTENMIKLSREYHLELFLVMIRNGKAPNWLPHS